MRARRGEIAFAGERIDRLTPPDIVTTGLIHVPEGRRIFPDMNVRENLELAMKLHQSLCLTAVLRAKRSAAQHEDHGIRSLEIRQFLMFAGMIAQFIIGKDRPWRNVGSHEFDSIVRRSKAFGPASRG